MDGWIVALEHVWSVTPQRTAAHRNPVCGELDGRPDVYLGMSWVVARKGARRAGGRLEWYLTLHYLPYRLDYLTYERRAEQSRSCIASAYGILPMRVLCGENILATRMMGRSGLITGVIMRVWKRWRGWMGRIGYLSTCLPTRHLYHLPQCPLPHHHEHRGARPDLPCLPCASSAGRSPPARPHLHACGFGPRTSHGDPSPHYVRWGWEDRLRFLEMQAAIYAKSAGSC